MMSPTVTYQIFLSEISMFLPHSHRDMLPTSRIPTFSISRISRISATNVYAHRRYNSFNRPGPIPLGDKQAQLEFEEALRRREAEVEAAPEDATHPDARKKLDPEFEGERNPETGEIGGPKNEPLRHGDWSFGGRVTDF